MLRLRTPAAALAVDVAASALALSQTAYAASDTVCHECSVQRAALTTAAIGQRNLGTVGPIFGTAMQIDHPHPVDVPLAHGGLPT